MAYPFRVPCIQARKFLCLSLLSFIACFGLPQNLLADIRVTGSSTLLPVIKHAAPEFTRKTGIRIIPRGGGSGAGVRGVLDGTASIGMVSRELHPDEALQLKAYAIGMDGVAVIVHQRNPLSGISYRQVTEVFSGKVKRWSALGGDNQDIQLVAKRQGRSTKELFENYFAMEGQVDKGAYLIGSNAEAIMFVAGDPFAIGYVSVGTAVAARDRGIPLKLLNLDGIEPNLQNIDNGSYLLTRPLNLVIKGEPSPEVERFIEFMLGPEGAEIVAREEFMPVMSAAPVRINESTQ